MKLSSLAGLPHQRDYDMRVVVTGLTKSEAMVAEQVLISAYEANVFASQVSLDDEEILEYIHYGYDIQRIASAMHTDANLVALKTDALIAQGYCLHHQEYENRFLK